MDIIEAKTRDQLVGRVFIRKLDKEIASIKQTNQLNSNIFDSTYSRSPLLNIVIHSLNELVKSVKCGSIVYYDAVSFLSVSASEEREQSNDERTARAIAKTISRYVMDPLMNDPENQAMKEYKRDQFSVSFYSPNEVLSLYGNRGYATQPAN